MTFVILTAGIDLSVGSILAVCAMTAAYVIKGDNFTTVDVSAWGGMSWLIGLGICLSMGTAIGFLHGLGVTRLRLPPFIVTLGGMTIWRGLTLVINDGAPIAGFDPGYRWWGRGELLGISIPIWIFALVAIGGYLALHKTRWGRFVYAIGGNPEAARLAGVNVKRVLVSVYVLIGCLAGLAGFILSARLGSAEAVAGISFELRVIASVVIGGTSLMGGYGRIGGTIIGSIIMGILINGLVLMNVSAYSPRDYLTHWLSQWVREYGIDGFRIDTAKHVEPAAWQQLKQQASAALAEWKRANPQQALDDAPFWMTGEAWGHGVMRSAYYRHGFDAMINFDYQEQAAQAQGCLADIDPLWQQMAAQLQDFNVLSYLSSHDTRLFRSDGSGAAALLLLAPGAVQIFYGDESGRPPGPTGSDPLQGTRSDMNWQDIRGPAAAQVAHWQRLGQFRARHPAIGKGEQTTVAMPQGYGFIRNDGRDRVMVVWAGQPESRRPRQLLQKF